MPLAIDTYLSMGDYSLPLLPVPVEDMTRDSLRSFIPQLISKIEGHEKVKLGNTAKPPWWPSMQPWSSIRYDNREESEKRKVSFVESLRNVVRSCYRYYGAEHLLQGHAGITAPESPIKVVNNVDGSVSFITQKAVFTLEERHKSKFANGIPPSELEAKVPCSVPSELSATPMPTHVFQSVHKELPCHSAQSNNRTQGSAIEVFICYFCEKDFHQKSDLHDHQAWCTSRPPELKNLPRKRKLKLIPVDDLTRPDKKNMVEALGLVPLSKARVLKKHQNRCKDIVITKWDDDSDSLKSPTPKTPRSLISQLSRDLSPPALRNRRKSLFGAIDTVNEEEKEVSEEENTQSEECKENHEREDKEEILIKKTSILSIDLSSALGQRVKKLMKEQAEQMMTTMFTEEQQDYEQYCHTPKKNGMLARLRHRTCDFPVTFRKSRKTLPKYAHQFKFRAKQRKEWYKTSLTGLNARSRVLKKLLKKCSVYITRLSKKEVAKWAAKRRSTCYVNISRLSDHYKPATALYTSPKQIAIQNFLSTKVMTAKPGQTGQSIYPQFISSTGQRVILHNGVSSVMSNSFLKSNPSNNVIDLTPPTTPENSQRPIHLVPSSPEQARMLQQLFQKPLQQRMAPYQSPVKRPLSASNSNVSKTNMKRKIEDSEVICVSSDEESESQGMKAPVSKRQKTEVKTKPAPTLLFKCHLCHAELTCFGNFSNYIEKHFAEKHKVCNIQLIEHTDNRGQKVVSIVEKMANKSPTKQTSQSVSQANHAGRSSSVLKPSVSTTKKLVSTTPTMHSNSNLNQNSLPRSGCNSVKLPARLKRFEGNNTKAKSLPNTPLSTRSNTGNNMNNGHRRSNRNNTAEVICID